MAIAAYERSGTTSLEAISRESPVHPHCGGRFFSPLLVITLLLGTVPHSPIAGLVAQVVAWEAILWLDRLWGLDKVPVLTQVSRLLQKYITTRHPGEIELRTAQTALQSLVAAHE